MGSDADGKIPEKHAGNLLESACSRSFFRHQPHTTDGAFGGKIGGNVVREPKRTLSFQQVFSFICHSRHLMAAAARISRSGLKIVPRFCAYDT